MIPSVSAGSCFKTGAMPRNSLPPPSNQAKSLGEQVKKAGSANAVKWFRIRKRNNHSALPLFETGVKQRERFIIHETGDSLSRPSRNIASWSGQPVAWTDPDGP